MGDMKDKAKDIAQNKEVVEAMKTLSKYGLGVLLVHSHDEQGNFTSLKPGIVACEEDLKVSFRKSTEIQDSEYVSVAWRWNDEDSEVQPVSLCRVAQWCEENS